MSHIQIKIDCNSIYFSLASMVRAPLNIMFQPNQMAVCRYERIPCFIRVHRIRVASTRIVRIYLKANASTVNPIKMLSSATRQCMILCHATTPPQANRIQRIFSITTNCVTFMWKETQCCRHSNQLVKHSW